jgi:hypothetical protein
MPLPVADMRNLVREELTHIPDYPEPQGDLRMIYWSRRMRSLGRKAVREQTRAEVLLDCVAFLRTQYPDYGFRYDPAYFQDERNDR